MRHKEIDRLKEALDSQKRRAPGTFERYNHDVLNYLHHNFPEEPESSILEAAAFISHRMAIVCQDMHAEMSRE